MKINAKLLQILDVEKFSSSNGEFQVQRIIVEQENQSFYNKELCVDINPDRINMKNFAIGSRLALDIELRSRNSNGRWFTHVRAWNISSDENANTPFYNQQIPGNKLSDNNFSRSEFNPTTRQIPNPASNHHTNDDLPFEKTNNSNSNYPNSHTNNDLTFEKINNSNNNYPNDDLTDGAITNVTFGKINDLIDNDLIVERTNNNNDTDNNDELPF